MSGIYGIINLKNNPVDPLQMNKMEELLIHRGVDGKAQWIDGHVGLGHLKLEITPESEYERLPLEYKQWVITADARIDNRDELDAAFSISEEERPFIPDTTYIVKAYEKWGKDCVKHLIGDFAFAIWDKVEQTLFCARDHIGIKPFFYLKTEDKFIFASELKTIVELREIPVELNESKLGDWMYRIQDLHNPTDTLFMNIKRLMPAHFGIAQSGNWGIEQYWKLKKTKEIKLPTDEAYAEKLRDLMIQAVECRMRTKYEIGVTLSGGLDSSSVACIAARKLAKEGKNLYTASSVLPDNWEGIEEDEREYIEAVVEQEKNIIPSYVSANNIGVFENLDESFEKYYLPLNPFAYIDLEIDKALRNYSNLRVKMNGFYGDIAVSNSGNRIFSILARQLKFKALIKITTLKASIYGNKVFQQLLKDIIKVILPQILINLYRKYKLSYKKNIDAFDLVLQESFKKNFQIEKISQDCQQKFYSCKTLESYIEIHCSSLVWALEEINIRNSHIDTEELNPLGDIRLLEFIVDVPLIHQYSNGWNRGFIRLAMNDIIPPKVQWRKYKTMYSPDFFYKLSLCSDFINNTTDKLWSNKCINVLKIKQNLLDIKLVKNWQDPRFDNAPVIYTIGFINFLFINFLSNKKILTNI